MHVGDLIERYVYFIGVMAETDVIVILVAGAGHLGINKFLCKFHSL